jgi:hypothetical protein
VLAGAGFGCIATTMGGFIHRHIENNSAQTQMLRGK